MTLRDPNVTDNPCASHPESPSQWENASGGAEPTALPLLGRLGARQVPRLPLARTCEGVQSSPSLTLRTVGAEHPFAEGPPTVDYARTVMCLFFLAHGPQVQRRGKVFGSWADSDMLSRRCRGLFRLEALSAQQLLLLRRCYSHSEPSLSAGRPAAGCLPLVHRACLVQQSVHLLV